MDIFDKNGTKAYTNWLDHYGDTDANLKAEMKQSIEEFILTTINYPLRLIKGVKPEQSRLQIYKDDVWTDIIY